MKVPSHRGRPGFPTAGPDVRDSDPGPTTGGPATGVAEVQGREFATDAPDRKYRVDLSDVWNEAGRPKGKSPRSWRRSTLGQAAIAHFAARRGVGREMVFRDPGGPKAHVKADPAVAVIYVIALDPGAGGDELDDMLRSCPAIAPEDIAAIEELLAAEARRKAEQEARSKPYREDAEFWREMEARSDWREAYYRAYAAHRTAGAGPEEARRAAVAAADELEPEGGDEPGRPPAATCLDCRETEGVTVIPNWPEGTGLCSPCRHRRRMIALSRWSPGRRRRDAETTEV